MEGVEFLGFNDSSIDFLSCEDLHGLSVVTCPAQMSRVLRARMCARTLAYACMHECACLYMRSHVCFTALGSLNELTMIPYLDLLRQTVENFYVEG